MYQIGVGFQGIKRPLRGDNVTSRGLHGVLFHVLEQYNAGQATWLHQHQSPKPYTMAPYYDVENGTLAGIRFNALTEVTAELLTSSWESVYRSGQTLRLGRQRFTVSDTACVAGPSFETLAALPPEQKVALRFLSPTTFRQGPGFLPLPLPISVFRGAYQSWCAFAPQALQCPGDWLDWCDKHVFVETHQIETVTVSLSQKSMTFTGFVGDVTFTAKSKSLLYLSIWQALAHLAPYTGVGYKTTMGMGAVGLV